MGHRVAPYLAEWAEHDRRQRAEDLRLAGEARTVATTLARQLVERFGARRVTLIGSLARGDFGAHSDIDLVVEALPPARFFEACAWVDERGEPFRVDLIPLEDANPLTRQRVGEEGQVLHEQA